MKSSTPLWMVLAAVWLSAVATARCEEQGGPPAAVPNNPSTYWDWLSIPENRNQFADRGANPQPAVAVPATNDGWPPPAALRRNQSRPAEATAPIPAQPATPPVGGQTPGPTSLRDWLSTPEGRNRFTAAPGGLPAEAAPSADTTAPNFWPGLLPAVENPPAQAATPRSADEQAEELAAILSGGRPAGPATLWNWLSVPEQRHTLIDAATDSAADPAPRDQAALQVPVRTIPVNPNNWPAIVPAGYEQPQEPVAATPSPGQPAEKSRAGVTALQRRPITSLTTNICVSKGDMPENNATPQLLQSLQTEGFPKADWTQICYCWDAPAMCYRPLYFEEENVERYGYTTPLPCVLQPVVSCGKFFLTVPILPYKMGANPPLEEVFDLGFYRPGSCAPNQIHYPPLSARGALLEAGTVTGLMFAVP